MKLWCSGARKKKLSSVKTVKTGKGKRKQLSAKERKNSKSLIPSEFW